MADLHDLNSKPVKLRAILSAGYLFGLATADRYPLDPADRSALWAAGSFFAELAGRPDLVPAEQPWPEGPGNPEG